MVQLAHSALGPGRGASVGCRRTGTDARAVAVIEAVEPRVLFAGQFDAAFGAGGLVRADLSQQGRTEFAQDLLVQPDGKLVVGGSTTEGSYEEPAKEFVVARFNPDGSPDTAFGAAGVGRVTFSAPALRGVLLDAIALAPDGKIVAGGLTVEYDFGYNWNFALARFNADGTPDTTFGDGGTVIFDFAGPPNWSWRGYDRVTALAVRPDGRVVAVGVSQTSYSDFALAQFNADGSLDTTFGDGGKTRHVVGYSAWPTAAELLPDGKLAVAGRTRVGITSLDQVSVAVLRYTADGRPDPTFGVGGVRGETGLVGATVDDIGPGGADDLVADPADGSLYVSAHAWPPQSTDPGTATQYLLRYTPDGRRDTGFGVNGLAYAGQVAGQELASLAMDGAGRLVSAMTSGHTRGITSGVPEALTWTLARHTRFGALDLSFGGAGTVTHSAAGPNATLLDLEALPGGGMVVAGTDSGVPSNRDAILARFLGGSDDVAGAGVLAGMLFKDSNVDGRRDHADPGVEGQSVYIDSDGDAAHDPGEPIVAADAGGRYRFTGLAPGTYTLRTLLTGVWRQTAPAPGAAHTWTLPAGGGLGGADFGLVQRPKITVSAFHDRNANGVSDPGEPALSGHTAYIDADNNGMYDTGEVSRLFAEDGTATFEVTPGTYRIRQLGPANFVQTTPGPGAAAHVVTVENEDVAGLAFGSISRFDVGRVEGFTYVDANGNGVKESAEFGIPGNTVYVDADNDGQLDPGEKSAVSDYRGFYQLTLLLPGTYTVRFLAQRGQVQTGPAGGQPRVVTVSGNGRAAGDFGYQWEVNRVVARHLFYNASAFDGGDPAANAADDDAIATDKRPLLPGQAASFANVSSYGRGINGVMIDLHYVRPDARVDGYAFTVRAGGSGDPSAWPLVPPWEVVASVRRGAGAGGSDRVTLTWADGRIKNTWLYVTVNGGVALGLPARDGFFFGSLVEETGDAASPLRVSAADVERIRSARQSAGGAGSVFDFNRDRRVNAVDLAVARASQRRSLPGLTAPTAVQAASTPSAAGAAPARRSRYATDLLTSS